MMFMEIHMIRPIATLDAAKDKWAVWGLIICSSWSQEYEWISFKFVPAALNFLPLYIETLTYSDYGLPLINSIWSGSLQQLGHWPATLSVLVSATTTWRENGKNVPFSLVPIISPHLWLSHSGSSSILFLGQCLQMCLPDKKAIHRAEQKLGIV